MVCLNADRLNLFSSSSILVPDQAICKLRTSDLLDHKIVNADFSNTTLDRLDEKEKVSPDLIGGDFKLSEFFFFQISSDLIQHLLHCMIRHEQCKQSLFCKLLVHYMEPIHLCWRQHHVSFHRS